MECSRVVALMLVWVYASCTSADPEAQAAKTTTGMVVDEAGKPIPGVTVCLLGAQKIETRMLPPPILGRCESGEDGQFALGTLPATIGPYERHHVVAFTSGRGIAWQEIRATTPTKGLTLVLLPAQPVAGHVTDEFGTPIPRATVRVESVSDADPEVFDLCPLQNPALGDVAFLTCGQDGSFRYQYLPPRTTLVLGIVAPGCAPLPGALIPVDKGYRWQQWPGMRVSDVAPVDPENLVLKLSPEAAITGRVLLPNGQPAAGIMVSVNSFGPERVEARTREDGQYRLGPLAEGRYSVIIENDDYVATAHESEVSAGQILNNIDFQLTQPGFVTGHVRDKVTGQPLSGATMAANSGARPGQPHHAETDERGAYRIRVMPGPVTVFPRYMPPGYHAHSADRRALQVAVGQTIADVDFAAEPAWLLEGMVVDEAGQPVEGAGIIWSPFWEMRPRRTAADGSFKLGGHKAAEPVFLLIRHEDRGLAALATLIPHAPGEVVQPARVVVRPCVKIAGQVVTTDYTSVPKAKVSLGVWFPEGEGIGLDDTVADEDGFFSFESAIPGVRHTVHASAPTAEPALRRLAGRAEVLTVPEDMVLLQVQEDRMPER